MHWIQALDMLIFQGECVPNWRFHCLFTLLDNIDQIRIMKSQHLCCGVMLI